MTLLRIFFFYDFRFTCILIKIQFSSSLLRYEIASPRSHLFLLRYFVPLFLHSSSLPRWRFAFRFPLKFINKKVQFVPLILPPSFFFTPDFVQTFSTFRAKRRLWNHFFFPKPLLCTQTARERQRHAQSRAKPFFPLHVSLFKPLKKNQTDMSNDKFVRCQIFQRQKNIYK